MNINRLRRRANPLFLAVFTFASLCAGNAFGEYGDIVMGGVAGDENMKPVVFSHSFHRQHFRCNVCHEDLGFKMKAGGNDITMAKIVSGEYCGGCHNGSVAWGPVDCERCHSGVQRAAR